MGGNEKTGSDLNEPLDRLSFHRPAVRFCRAIFLGLGQLMSRLCNAIS